MPQMLSPFDLGAPIPIAPKPGSTPPLGSSIVKALLAKHAASAAAPGSAISDMGTFDKPSPADVPAPVSLAPAQPVAQAAGPSIATAAAALPGADVKKPGLFDRIGDFLHSDEGKAALLRSGAATLQGGLGAGIQAGADFVDRRRAAAAAAAMEQARLALEGQQIGNTYNLGLGRLGVERATAGETARHNRSTEGTANYNIDSENYRQGRDLNFRQWEHVTPSGDTTTAQAGENYRHDNASGDTTATQQGENFRHGTPSGDKELEVRLQTAPKINLHAHYSTTPEEFAANGPRLKPSMVKPAGQPVRINGDADYAALPSGAQFIGPDGQLRTKP